MIRCSFKPYEGNEAYIFISYSHKDKMLVFPVIEKMAQDGYNIWYDEGIDPGSEWPETIANHLDNCDSFISFISKNSLSSANCRREINFALKKNKPFISVILEEVEMSLGMDMQLSANQSIFKYTFEREEDFFAKLYEAKFLRNSYSETVIESDESDSISESNSLKEEKPKTANTKKEKTRKTKAKKTATDKPKKRRISTKKILLTVVAVIAFIIALGMIIYSANTVTVGKITYLKSEKVVQISNRTVNEDDIRNINKIRNAKYITFDTCIINAGVLKTLNDSKAGIETVTISSCTGVDSLSFINSLNSLSDLTVTDCSISDEIISTLDLSNHNNLTKIDFRENPEITDITFLTPVSNSLDTLILDETSANNFELLNGFKRLKYLSACGCGIESIPPFEDVNLGSLYLGKNKITDISVISSMTSLVNLDLSNNKISDISPLSKLTGLEVLNLSNNNISSLSALSPMSGLRRVNVKNNMLKSLTGLENSLKLYEIIADNNDLAGLYELSNCTVLEIVSLSGNGLVSIKQLEKSSETLTTVYLADNYLVDELQYISAAENIEYLDISNCSIKSLEPLTKLTKLTKLDASDNSLTSLKGIGNAPLKYLNVANNKISELNELPTAVNSTNCVYDLSNNQFSELPSFNEKMSFSKLFVHSNNITNFDSLASIRSNSISFSLVQDISNSEIEKLANSEITRFYVVDSPADRKVKCESLLKNVVFVDSKKPDEDMITGLDFATDKVAVSVLDYDWDISAN